MFAVTATFKILQNDRGNHLYTSKLNNLCTFYANESDNIHIANNQIGL